VLSGERGNLIHAEGVRGGFPSSAPKARILLAVLIGLRGRNRRTYRVWVRRSIR